MRRDDREANCRRLRVAARFPSRAERGAGRVLRVALSGWLSHLGSRALSPPDDRPAATGETHAEQHEPRGDQTDEADPDSDDSPAELEREQGDRDVDET